MDMFPSSTLTVFSYGALILAGAVSIFFTPCTCCLQGSYMQQAIPAAIREWLAVAHIKLYMAAELMMHCWLNSMPPDRGYGQLITAGPYMIFHRTLLLT